MSPLHFGKTWLTGPSSDYRFLFNGARTSVLKEFPVSPDVVTVQNQDGDSVLLIDAAKSGVQGEQQSELEYKMMMKLLDNILPILETVSIQKRPKLDTDNDYVQSKWNRLIEKHGMNPSCRIKSTATFQA
jgi:hypothetical protein